MMYSGNKPSEISDYYNALAESDQAGSPEPFRRFVDNRVLESLQGYLEILEP